VSRPVTWAAPFVIKKMGVIYKITSPSGRVYVGKTKRLKIRIWEYRWRSKKRKSIIHDSIKGYGWEAHKLEVIEEIADELLNEREVFWIKELNTFYLDNEKGMNMTRGGDGNVPSWKHNTERRKKQAQRFSGEGNPFYGKTHSEETKKRLAKVMSKRNKSKGIKIPEWAAEKGREAVRKAVIMYNSDGEFLKEYISATQAAKDLGFSRSCINDVVRGKHTNTNGYVFRYKTDNYPLKIDVGVIKSKNVKRQVFCEYAGEVMVFDGSEEASKYLGIPKTTINRAAMYNNGKPIRAGYKFFYKENRPRIAGRAA
jgi:group I intron endonuclease